MVSLDDIKLILLQTSAARQRVHPLGRGSEATVSAKTPMAIGVLDAVCEKMSLKSSKPIVAHTTDISARIHFNLFRPLPKDPRITDSLATPVIDLTNPKFPCEI